MVKIEKEIEQRECALLLCWACRCAGNGSLSALSKHPSLLTWHTLKGCLLVSWLLLGITLGFKDQPRCLSIIPFWLPFLRSHQTAGSKNPHLSPSEGKVESSAQGEVNSTQTKAKKLSKPILIHLESFLISSPRYQRALEITRSLIEMLH